MNYSIAMVIICLIFPIIGYLSGSLLWSVIIGKVFYGKDIRDFESKNAGATNSSRVLGKKAGIVILILDILKSYIPTMSIWLIVRYTSISLFLNNNAYFNEYAYVYITGLFALIGHCWPVFFKFKGGKGSSCYGGLLLAISPFVGLLQLFIFIALIIIFKYVSLSSLISSITALFLIFIPGLNWLYMTNEHISNINLVNGWNNYGMLLFILAILCCCSIVLIFKHKANVYRLQTHTERKTILFK